MTLLLLLLVPVAVGLIARHVSRGEITLKEFLAMELACLAVMGGGYALALHGRSADTELWNSAIAEKHEGRVSCCHSYSCNCRESCTGSGSSKSCSTTCDTCYEHSTDPDWVATTTTGETAYSSGCRRAVWGAPSRWEQIRVGEPASTEHSFQNYIMGNPDSILRRQGAAEKWRGRLPEYPQVYDHYRANHLVAVGRALPDQAALQLRLGEINAELGPKKQANVIVVVVPEADPSYAEGLREHWLGGKKNDLIVVVGTPQFPKIAWASVVSWSKSEELKITLRDSLAGTDWAGAPTLDAIAQQVSAGFQRRNWHDFDYLSSTVEPSSTATVLLLILGVVLAVGMAVYFRSEDPFNERFSRRSF